LNSKPVFPLKDVGKCCANKWAWSTIWLNRARTSSCHRVEQLPLDINNFDNFHNLPKKIEDREKMMRGEWPHGWEQSPTADKEGGCQYCQRIEESGGMSDRLQVNDQIDSEEYAIKELSTDPTATRVTPTIVEIFAENTCNLKCLYCFTELSSGIEHEVDKFGPIKFEDQILTVPHDKISYTNELKEKFFTWLRNNILDLRRLHLLGGETYIQHDLINEVIDILEKNPNPKLCLNIFSNFNAPKKFFYGYNEKIKDLQKRGHIKRFDLTFSIDCWGPQQSYVRSGLDLDLAEEYWAWACNEPEEWLYLNVNSTIGCMTIKTMPEMIEMVYRHSKDRLIGHYFSFLQSYSFQQAEIFDWSHWEHDFERILSVMKRDTIDQQDAYNRMLGIRDTLKKHCKRDETEIMKLHSFLDQIDQRRGTNWRNLFDYLD